MANVTIRRQNGDKPIPATPSEQTWDPWRTMRSLLAWDPFREMAPFPVFEERAIAFSPAFDVKETKDAYLFKADLPGVKEDDLDVSLTGNRLTVSGHREEEKRDEGDRYYAFERSYGTFSRSFTLPEGVDAEHANAELKDGVLTISVAKRPEVKPKKIEVAKPTTGKGEKAKA